MTASPAGSSPPESLMQEARAILTRHGLRPQKQLGQNFLIAPGVLRAGVAAADLSSADTVIEVGPGLGFLTRELAQSAGRVVAVELDRQLASILKETMSGSPNVSVVGADILQTDPIALLSGRGQETVAASPDSTPAQAYKVVANLPYYISSPVLRHFLEAERKPRLMVLMLQKEVAQRISAHPPNMSLLSVSVQVYGRPRIVRPVPAGAFYPRPDVDSALVRIEVYDRPAVDVDDMDAFFRLVSAGFSQPRKQIHNAMSQRLWFPPDGATAVLEAVGIDPRRRAETLSLAEWERLYHEWRKLRPMEAAE